MAGSVNFVDDEDNISVWYQDLTGHGTTIASVIVGDEDNGFEGVNSEVDLYSVKVLDENNQAPISRIVEGIYWCIENDINIINMSFGTSSYSKALEKAVEDAYNNNILMVAAAGNKETDVEYPAAFEEVMAVASTNTSSEISDFSNTGEELDVAAPGEKIKVLGFFGLNGVTQGTSIAVPHVVGVASLLLEKDLTKSNEFIRQLITYSSKEIENTDYCGLVDAEYALEIYDEFDENFGGTDLVNKESIPTNEENVETFEEIEDDTAYVEGRWSSNPNSKNSHLTLVEEQAKLFSTIGTTELAILKAGAVYPDKSNSGISGGTTHWPEFHGGYKYNTADGTSYAVNYIACYEFITRIALKNGDASSFKSRTAILGLGSESYYWIKDSFTSTKVGDRKWSKVLPEIKVNGQSVKDTKKNRKYFTWGIALHALADMFSHKTYRKSDKKQIVHDIKNEETSNCIEEADNPNIVVKRWEAAQLATFSSIECLEDGVFGDYMEIDYALRNLGTYSDKDMFLKKRLLRYANSNSGGLTKAEKTRFTNANID